MWGAYEKMNATRQGYWGEHWGECQTRSKVNLKDQIEKKTGDGKSEINILGDLCFILVSEPLSLFFVKYICLTICSSHA